MDLSVFSARGQTVCVADVIDAAYVRGDLDPAWREVLLFVEASDGRVTSPDEASLQARSERFRADRDLITAEETEEWLQERGLSLDDFSDYFVRRDRREKLPMNAPPPVQDYAAAPLELRALLRAELLLGGEFDRLAEELARRYAALSVVTPHADTDEERSAFLERARWPRTALPGLGRSESWLDEMLRLERAYQQQRAAVLTAEALARSVELLR